MCDTIARNAGIINHKADRAMGLLDLCDHCRYSTKIGDINRLDGFEARGDAFRPGTINADYQPTFTVQGSANRGTNSAGSARHDGDFGSHSIDLPFHLY